MSITISGYQACREIIGGTFTFASSAVVRFVTDETPTTSVVIQNVSTVNVVNVHNSVVNGLIVHVLQPGQAIVLPMKNLAKIWLSGTSGQSVRLLGVVP